MVLKFLLYLYVMITPPMAWGFSLSEVPDPSMELAELQTQAQLFKLGTKPEWLALGHYQVPSFYRRFSALTFTSKIRGNFFLDPNGWKDPDAELKKTLEVLFFTQPWLQCRYLARTSWLTKVLRIPKSKILDCPERREWKDRLHAKQVSLIFASSDMNNAASSFGHTFLKFHDPKNLGSLDVMDYAIDFSARTGTDQGSLFALKGLFGFYPGVYGMLPYHQKMKDYINLEGRDIWEYTLSLTEDEIEKILDHLLELEGSYVPYYFLDDNCSYQILELLQVVRPSLGFTKRVTDAVIPLDSLKWIHQSPGLVTQIKYRPSLMTEWRHSYKDLTHAEKRLLKKIVTEIHGNSSDVMAANKDEMKNRTLVAQARLDESVLRYLSVREYNLGKDFSDEKYPWMVARSQLGKIYQTPDLPVPKNPVLSHGSQSLWLGLSNEGQNHPEYRNSHDNASNIQTFIEYRRAFHDLLSSEFGASAYSHMEVLGFQASLDLQEGKLSFSKFTFLKMLSTSSVNELERPLSWRLDSGWTELQKIYMESSAGVSYDFPDEHVGRLTLFAEARLDTWQNRLNPWLGTRWLWVQKDNFDAEPGRESDLQFYPRWSMEISALWPVLMTEVRRPWVRSDLTVSVLRNNQNEGRIQISYDDHPALESHLSSSSFDKIKWMLLWVRHF